jgi:hypothetical protein
VCSLKLRKEITAVLILFLVVCLRFSPFILQGKPIDSDAWKSIYPWKSEFQNQDIRSSVKDMDFEYGVWFPIVKDEISNGRFPHWNMYSFCGTPLYANHLVPVFHIPFAISLLWPSNLVATAYVFLMTLFGTMFFYCFLRNRNFGIFVSLVGGVIYVLNGWLCNLAPPEAVAFVWVPAILLFFDRSLKWNRLTDICLCAFCAGQFLLAGYPISIIHFSYVLIAYSVWCLFRKENQRRVNFRRWLFAVVTICTLGLMFSAVQNYPTYQLMKLSTRDVKHYAPGRNMEKPVVPAAQSASSQSEPPKNHAHKTSKFHDLATVIVPCYDGGSYHNRLLVGPFVFLLFITGLFLTGRRFPFMKVCLLLFGMLSFFDPLYLFICKYVPGYSITPSVPVEVFYFILYFLAVLGFDHLLKLEKRSVVPVILSVVTIVLVVASFNLAGAGDLRIQFNPNRWNPETDNIVKWIYILSSILLIILTCLYTTGDKVKRYFKAVLLSLLIVSGLLGQFYIYPLFYQKNLMPLNDEMKSIIQKCDNGRIIRFSTDKQVMAKYQLENYVLPPNIPARFKIMDAFGYDSFMLEDYYQLFEKFAPKTVILGRGMLNITDLEYLKNNEFFFNAAGIRYCLSFDQPELSGIFGSPIYDGSIQVYKISAIEYPYARFYSSFEYQNDLPDRNDQQRIIPVVYLEDRPVLPDGRTLESVDENIDSSSIVISRTHTSTEIKFDAPRDCILYLSDSFHPDWRAKIDGVNAKIIKANMSFRAIAVPGGKHTVTMWYDGSDVVSSGMFSLFALFVCIILIVFDRKVRKTNI